MIPYRATPGVPAELLRYLTRLLAAERRLRGTPARSRKLTCRGQAVLALRWFRDRTRIEALGRVLDGKVFAGDRCAEEAVSVPGRETGAWYSGKNHCHGGNCQAVMRPAWLPLRAGPADPGSAGDLTGARRHAFPVLYRFAARGLPVLAGAGIGIVVPFRNYQGKHDPGPDARFRNTLLRELRCQGERGFALLTRRWAALQHITASPSRTTEITRAALVLTQVEHKYIR